MGKFNKGMQVFDVRYGWGTVTCTQSENDEYPIIVVLCPEAGGSGKTYTTTGKSTIYHNIPVLLLPEEVPSEYLKRCPRPKHKKTVKYKRWVVIYPDGRCETRMEEGQRDGMVDIREIEHEFEIEI